MQRTASIAAQLTLLAVAAFAHAQSQVPVSPHTEATGSVSGHVFCADTNKPARFARVSLEAIPDPAKDSKAKSSAGNGAGDVSSVHAQSSVQTTLDGSFTLTGVKPGNYYVVAQATGYVSPSDIFTQKQIEDPSPDMRALIASAIPRVTVQNGHTEQAEVRLERGAAVSGTILYDDGSPASGVHVVLLHKDPTGKWVGLKSPDAFDVGATTNDRGYFRIASLLGDEYLVQANLQLTSSKAMSTPADGGGHVMEFEVMDVRFTLPFYGSGMTRMAQAKGFKLLAGQELTGQDMTLPIAKLHKLTGRVVAGADGHAVSAAKVALVTRDDNKELSTVDVSRDDGLFHFEFVPDGDYILRVSDARDVVWEPAAPTPNAGFTVFPTPDKERVTATYGGIEQAVLFSGDMLGITVTVPPDSESASAPAAASN